MSGRRDLGPMVAVRAFVEAFNDHDIDLAAAACADETLLIDDFPPYAWSGEGAVTTWYHDMVSMADAYGMSEWSVALRDPGQETVSDRGAYVVVPVDVRWLQDGTPAQRAGSMTMAVREGAAGWRISACAWTWS